MTKKLSKDERIREIVAAAVAEFLEKGYENTTMEAIAMRAGLTKGGLYHHFDSKDEILGFANLSISEPVKELMDRASKEPSALNGINLYIRGYIKYWTGRPREIAFLFLTMSKAFEIPRIRDLFSEYYQTMYASLVALFKRAIEEGTLRQDDPTVRTAVLMSALDGIIANLMLDPSLNTESITNEIQNIFIGNFTINPPKNINGINR
jgi:AcrR family transcriptional regulator